MGYVKKKAQNNNMFTVLRAGILSWKFIAAPVEA